MEQIKKIIVPLLSGVAAFGFAYYEPVVALVFGVILLVLSLFSWGDAVVKSLKTAALVFVLVGLLTGTIEFIQSYIVKELAARETERNSAQSEASMLAAHEEADKIRRNTYLKMQKKYLMEAANSRNDSIRAINMRLADLCEDSIRAINAQAAVRRASFDGIFQGETSSASTGAAQTTSQRSQLPPPFPVEIPPGEKRVTEYIMEAGASYEIRASSEYVFEHSDQYGRPAFTTMPKLGYWQVGSRNGNLTVKNLSSSDTLRIEIRKEA